MGKLTRYNVHEAIERVDKEAGIIYGVSLLTANREASGHNEFVDETMVNQAVALMQRAEQDGKPGLRSRFDHPAPCSNSMGKAVGRFKNGRREGLKAVGDLHLLAAAAKSPAGDLRSYVLDLAEEDPDIFATSIVFKRDKPVRVQAPEGADKTLPEFRLPHARISSLHACDVVDSGAANDGIFGRPDYMAEQAEKFADENPALFKRLFDRYFNNTNQETPEMEQQLQAMTTERDTAVTALSAATAQVEKLTADVAAGVESTETARTEGRAEGEATGRTALSDRVDALMKEYKDPAFVIAHFAKDDLGVKDAFIAHLQNRDNTDKDGLDYNDGENAGEGDGESYTDLVGALVKDKGYSKQVAHGQVQESHPALYQKYLTRKG